MFTVKQGNRVTSFKDAAEVEVFIMDAMNATAPDGANVHRMDFSEGDDLECFITAVFLSGDDQLLISQAIGFARDGRLLKISEPTGGKDTHLGMGYRTSILGNSDRLANVRDLLINWQRIEAKTAPDVFEDNCIMDISQDVDDPDFILWLCSEFKL